MKIAISFFVIIRILIGGLFIVSGFEKLIGPYQNFLYVVQSYEFLNPAMNELTARLLPWIELFLGVFIVLGLWLHWMLRALFFLIVLFILVVGQALIRDLPITECGCFGDLVSFPPYVVILFDSVLLVLTGLLIKRKESVELFSLDRTFYGS